MFYHVGDSDNMITLDKEDIKEINDILDLAIVDEYLIRTKEHHASDSVPFFRGFNNNLNL